MAELKVGDKVKVIGNGCGSINQVGDKGTIIEVLYSDDGKVKLSNKVSVKKRENIINWHPDSELEVIKSKD